MERFLEYLPEKKPAGDHKPKLVEYSPEREDDLAEEDQECEDGRAQPNSKDTDMREKEAKSPIKHRGTILFSQNENKKKWM